MRTVVIHRADKITGPYEGKLALQDLGVAQGGLIDTPDGKWFAYLFRDYGAVGRIPYLVPVEWEDGWPVLGKDGKVPMYLNLPASNGLIPGIVASDNFKRKKKEPKLPPVWQWNHNPDNKNWDVNGKKGYFRLTTGRIDNNVLEARNILTQRTIGPKCTGETKINVSKMKEGDVTGLILLQEKYGYAGVKFENGKKYIVMVNAGGDKPEEIVKIPLKEKNVYFKAECDFTDRRDTADFFYSLDGNNWNKIGTTLHMKYTLSHFMGYRYGLFNYASKTTGGYVDFDYFNIKN